jgi:hypothetical protein
MVENSTVKNLELEIEKMRKNLEKLLLEEGFANRVIKLSQELDKKIVIMQRKRFEQFNMRAGS